MCANGEGLAWSDMQHLLEPLARLQVVAVLLEVEGNDVGGSGPRMLRHEMRLVCCSLNTDP